MIAWLEATQPEAWEALSKNHGQQAADVVLGRLRDALNQRGTLDVLRHGIELLGLRQPLALAQFKPALAMNPDILAKYAANRLRVVRQVRYSLHNENAIDLVLFLNGIPVATCGVEERLHAVGGGRGGSIPLRPRPTTEGTELGGASAQLLLTGRWCILRSAIWLR